MKKFNFFLLTAVLLFFTPIELNAFTTITFTSQSFQKIENIKPLFTQETKLLSSNICTNLELKELQITTFNSTNLIANNLKVLYSICFALVLFNLAAQIKIIFKIVHLFFQFQEKDEHINFDF